MQKILLLGIVFVLTVTFSGCDQFKTMQEYFSPAKQKTAAPAASVTPQASKPQATPLPAPAPSAKAPLPANVLARVGDWTLTLEEFNERLRRLKEVAPDFDLTNDEDKRLILEELVRQQLLIADAEQSGVAKQKDVVDAVEEFRRTILVREVANKLAEGIKATEADAETYYNENKQVFTDPTEWHVREIVTNTPEGAKELLIQLLGAADFTQTAKERSITKSAANGGDLGFIKQAPFPQMETVLSTMAVGDISSVFKGPEGFYIIKLEEKRGGTAKNFAQVKEEVVSGLTLLKQQEAILNHLNTLSQKIPIQVNESLLGPIKKKEDDNPPVNP